MIDRLKNGILLINREKKLKRGCSLITEKRTKIKRSNERREKLSKIRWRLLRSA